MKSAAFQPLRFQLSDGPLLDAINKSEEARLKKFIRDEDSEALKIFHPSQKDCCDTGDWYGEHAGKWLVTACKAYHRTESLDWATRILTVVDFLESQQEPSGYLGTYGADSPARFTNGRADSTRTWDIWIHSWMILGLLDAGAVPGCEKAFGMAHQIGELILKTFHATGRSPITQGNHHGLSSLVLLEPLARLADTFDDPRYAELAEKMLVDASAQGLPFLECANQPMDVTQIGTGKAYQIIWCLQGIVALYKITLKAEYLAAAENIWRNIRDYHLTPQGGPWGGIAAHKEVFNPPNFFDPCGLVETCSSTSWLILSQELFAITGNSDYLVEIEKTVYNSVLGAMDANGADWCYFIFPNGRRNNTYHWACCKSSGALALESSTAVLCGEMAGVPCLTSLVSGSFVSSSGIEITAQWQGSKLTLSASGQTPAKIYIPAFTKLAVQPVGSELQGDWLILPEVGSEPIEVKFESPISIKSHVQSVDHHGQEIVREEYACVTRGRYVYATGKFEGYRTQETIRLPQLNPASVFTAVSDHEIELRQPGRDPIKFVPYWLCGDQHDGAWRTTWLQVAWQ